MSEEQIEMLKNEKCKDCYWFSCVTVDCCEIDGSEPCNPNKEACSRFEPKDEN